jgi:O-antigen ligase
MGMGSSFLYLTVVAGVEKTRKKIGAIVLLWSVAIVIVGFFIYANQETINRRINEGTNRQGIFKRVFNVLENSEFYEIVIGHGDQRSISVLGGYTHNDWLMLIYDYGIIGIILMINVYLSMIRLLWRLCKLKSPLSMPFLSVLILMAGVQQYSIGLQLKTFGLIMGSIGLVVGIFCAEYGTKS